MARGFEAFYCGCKDIPKPPRMPAGLLPYPIGLKPAPGVQLIFSIWLWTLPHV